MFVSAPVPLNTSCAFQMWHWDVCLLCRGLDSELTGSTIILSPRLFFLKAVRLDFVSSERCCPLHTTFIRLHQSGWIQMLRWSRPRMIGAQRQTSCKQLLYGNECRPSLHWAVSASLYPLQSMLADSSRDWCVSHYVHHLYLSPTPGWNIFNPPPPQSSDIDIFSWLGLFCSRLIYLQMRSPLPTYQGL